jgi:hypothetical protein
MLYSIALNKTFAFSQTPIPFNQQTATKPVLNGRKMINQVWFFKNPMKQLAIWSDLDVIERRGPR